MGQTITENIFSAHCGKEVFANQIIECDIDMAISNDITTPFSIKAFEQSGVKSLAKPDNFYIIMDHFIPAKGIASANQARISRAFAKKHNLKNFFDERDMEIEHALLPEKGLAASGDVIIGVDSHTYTHGALVSSPTCGTRLGRYMGILGNNERCISTMNRNFIGRIGSHTSGVYLVNSAIVAKSAIADKIADPRN